MHEREKVGTKQREEYIFSNFFRCSSEQICRNKTQLLLKALPWRQYELYSVFIRVYRVQSRDPGCKAPEW